MQKPQAEAAAFPKLAGDAQGPAEGSGDSLGDRQSQSESFDSLQSGGWCAKKRVEQLRDILVGNSTSHILD
jgi:hypothetical protein